jgi:site-specific DNA-methyltransferase (adenine-specific)
MLRNEDALEVAASMKAGSARLIYCDGPYGLDFGEWDRAKGEDLVEWYRPFFDSFDRLAMPSASLVVFGSSASWAWLHCDLVRRGWRYAGSIVWDKGNSTTAMRADPTMLRSWAQTHEHAAIYQRDELQAPTCAATTVAYAAGASDRNWIRVWLGDEWAAAGLKRSEADRAMGTNGMAGHYFGASQWALPTWDAYKTLADYAQKHGKPRDGLPWLVHPDAPTSAGATYEHLRATYEHLRAEYERLRAPFNLDRVIGSVWRETSPTISAARHGHPCEKPPTLTRKLIETLTLPGDLVFEPFGGSSPVARVCEAMPQELRRAWVSCEIDPEYVKRTREMLARLQGSLF